MIRDPPTVLEWSLAPPLNTLGPSGFPVLLTHPSQTQHKTRSHPSAMPVTEAQQGVPHSCRGKWNLTHSVATKTVVLVAEKAQFSVILLLSLAQSFNNSPEH